MEIDLIVESDYEKNSESEQGGKYDNRIVNYMEEKGKFCEMLEESVNIKTLPLITLDFFN